MNELRAVVEAAERARIAGRPAILATVVRVRGSSYRKPGARMFLTDEGWQAGSVSGGCLEADILRRAWWRTRDGNPALVTYDSTISDDADLTEELSHGFGLGCNGVVEALLEHIAPDSPTCPIAFIAGCLRDRCSGVIATVIATTADSDEARIGQRLFLRSDTEISGTITDQNLTDQLGPLCHTALNEGQSRNVTLTLSEAQTAGIFLEIIHPPMPLLICGAGHDAAPLSRIASELGWAVTIVDPRVGVTARPDRFPHAEATLVCAPDDLCRNVTLDARTAVVVMSHNTALDAALLAALLSTPVRYIGVLGPRHRTERLIENLGNKGTALPGLERVYGPVGIDIGADNPETIALSIVAEIQAVTMGKAGGHRRGGQY